TYDLTGGESGQTYTVKLLLSEDGGYSWKGPVTEVSGDVGTGITAGYTKHLTWDVLSEPGRDRLQGDRIAFKIRAEFTPRAVITSGSTGKPCPGTSTITDPRDRQVYPTVQIGTQCWLKKNMNYQTGNSWCYGNKESNCNTYGRLYDWETALKVCPSGWHLPSDEEWTKLTEFLGGSSVAGGKMKVAGTLHWRTPNEGAINSSGFTALPGGYRYYDGDFDSHTSVANFWSSSQVSAATAWYWALICSGDYVYRFNYGKEGGFSARCLQD
ncbi:MAG: fibrobacter succinogenes major paralogous domain-containing protein, partial [Bacteroidota bacterium]